jgi:hypothetical protein
LIQDKWIKIEGKYFLHIKTTFTNYSKDTLVFQAMSCSWQDNYILSSTDYTIEKSFCYRNAPINIILPPDSNYTRIITLSTFKRPLILNPDFITIGIKLTNHNITSIPNKSVAYWTNTLGLSSIPVIKDPTMALR